MFWQYRMKVIGTLCLMLLPLWAQAEWERGMAAAMVTIVETGTLLLSLLAGGLLLALLRVPETALAGKTSARLGYVAATALLAALVITSLSALLSLAWYAFAGRVLPTIWPDESLLKVMAPLALLSVFMLTFAHRPLALRAVLVGNVLNLLVIAGLLRPTGPTPVTPSSMSDPLGLVPTKVRDAFLPPNVDTNLSQSFSINGYKMEANDEQPGFPGGDAGLHDFVENRLHYPLIDRLMRHQGYVDILFTIQADGRITNITTLGTVGWYCTAEAQRVVATLPGFAPARRNGKPFAAKFVLTFAFSSN